MATAANITITAGPETINIVTGSNGSLQRLTQTLASKTTVLVEKGEAIEVKPPEKKGLDPNATYVISGSNRAGKDSWIVQFGSPVCYYINGHTYCW